MQTTFSSTQLADPEVARSNDILRSCVHCGFCTATCPTYQILGDELDSPRGRIYLIKDMLENERVPSKQTVKHIDRCLSCLACMTTCPSGVHYMHLVDHARKYIEQNYKRPLGDRFLRYVLSKILPHPLRFRVALLCAKIARPFAWMLPDQRIKAMLEMAPKVIPPVSRNDDPQSFPAKGEHKKRVALMTGCAQKALNTDINDATVRLLTRLGCEVVISKDAGCCGALAHHLGKEQDSLASARNNIIAWSAESDGEGLDAIIVNTSGCGTVVKDYGCMFQDDPKMADKASRISELAKDITEFIEELGLPKGESKQTCVAYHAACSLQHGQQVVSAPKNLLRRAGFHVVEPSGSHLCCGSAGTYNLLQPAISAQLKERKVKTLDALKPDIIVAGNIGCMMQIGSATATPVLHTVELLDWATGGPRPQGLGPGTIDHR